MIKIEMEFTNGAEARHELTEFAELIMNGAAPNFMQIGGSGITIEKRRTTKPLPDVIDCEAASTQPVAKVVQYGENGAAQASEPLQKTQPPTPTVSAAADSEHPRPQPAPTVPASPAAPQPPAPPVVPLTVPQPVSVQPVAAPPQQPAPVQTVSRQQLISIMTAWVASQTDGSNMAKLKGLLAKYNVDAMPKLRDEDIPAFVADAKAVGVQF